MLGLILLYLNFSFATTAKTCPMLFENGHNKPLQAVMRKMQEHEFSLHEFVNGLQPPLSKYIAHSSTRNIESLDATLNIAIKYERLLIHIIEAAQTTMMSPRIEMKDVAEHESFKKNYQASYVEYLALVTTFRQQLEALKNQPLELWQPAPLNDTLRAMHTAMGEAHNRF